MLRAIIQKASTPAVLLKYNDILKSLDGTFLTNLSDESIIEIVKYLINHSGKFEISSYSLNGSDASRACYSSGSTPLYVMIPNSKTLEQAKEYIQAVLRGEKPDIETDASELADVKDTQEVIKSEYKEPSYTPLPSVVVEEKEEEGEDSSKETDTEEETEDGEDSSEEEEEDSSEETDDSSETSEEEEDSSNEGD